jgi:hypothetical protein
MSKQEYIKALNREIQKLNGVIDWKIIHHADYHREARRHRTLLAQLRREEARRKVKGLFRFLMPAFR